MRSAFELIWIDGQVIGVANDPPATPDAPRRRASAVPRMLQRMP
jgi:hypothetical protein